MKTLKISILSVFAAIVFFCGINSSSFAAQTQTNSVTSIVRTAGPRSIWIAGHYKHNKFGKLVWVPGHWKRI